MGSISHHIGLYFYSFFSITDLIVRLVYIYMYVVNSWFVVNRSQFSVTRYKGGYRIGGGREGG